MKKLRGLIILLCIICVVIMAFLAVLIFLYGNNNTSPKSNFNFDIDNTNYIYDEVSDNTLIPETIENNVIEELEEEPEIEEKTVKEKVSYIEDHLAEFSLAISNNIEYAYELLDEEYKEKRFGNIEEFTKFISNKGEQLQNIKLMQYNIVKGDNDTRYIGTDKYGNYYKIIENEDMSYTLILDNYTLKDYSDLSEEERIKNYANDFILMLNACDYKNAYNLLDDNFKGTNFQTQQDFEEYVKKNFFERNLIESKEITEDGLCKVSMREAISTLSNRNVKEFKINLIDSENYTIEFNL